MASNANRVWQRSTEGGRGDGKQGHDRRVDTDGVG